MGTNWVGFAGSPKAPAGAVIVETATMTPSRPVAECVALLTTTAGLAAWLGAAAGGDVRRGATLHLETPSGGFDGTFTVLDIPRRVALVTDRHGEIDIRLDVRAVVRIDVTVRRLVPAGEDADAIRGQLTALLDDLRTALGA